MGASWQHPDLGRFEFDERSWITTIRAPAFNAFNYKPRYSNDRKSTGVVELSFEADDKDDIPSTAAIAIASSVLANQET